MHPRYDRRGSWKCYRVLRSWTRVRRKCWQRQRGCAGWSRGGNSISSKGEQGSLPLRNLTSRFRVTVARFFARPLGSKVSRGAREQPAKETRRTRNKRGTRKSINYAKRDSCSPIDIASDIPASSRCGLYRRPSRTRLTPLPVMESREPWRKWEWVRRSPWDLSALIFQRLRTACRSTFFANRRHMGIWMPILF